MNQADKLKKYIEQLQAQAFEEGVKVTTKALSKQMSAIEGGQIRHGNWETVDKDLYVYRCSECGDVRQIDDMPIFKFCPYCGAKMDKEVE